MKQHILAANFDASCNGTVFVFGGAAGATHALWCTLDSAPAVPGWSAAAFPKAIVGLSGPYDLAIWRPAQPERADT